ncbi:hypothetical protein ACIG3E_32890 [Streptomyces sp. NPDC053474]|uniref:hypothetical protein n=1 Tax=Streptomyces sp. NPDC053474 TaxID=3365704 RepID=UPI0037D3281E
MAQRTFVAITVDSADLEQARAAFATLTNAPFEPIEVTSKEPPGKTTRVSMSLPGDVREDVEERLAAVTSLPYEVEVRDVDLPQ